WGKAPCDLRFLREMSANCGWNGGCQGVAYAYYAAVRDYGWFAWYNSSWFHRFEGRDGSERPPAGAARVLGSLGRGAADDTRSPIEGSDLALRTEKFGLVVLRA